MRLGCAHLEEALALLEEAGLAGGMSKLATEIQEGLRQLKPDCLIEHLKVNTLASVICWLCGIGHMLALWSKPTQITVVDERITGLKVESL
jgi:hypothetical protein